MVKRVWKCKKRFVIFDALGQYCGPSEPIALLIQRMLLRNVTPAFIVTDVPSLLRIYGDHVSLRDNSLQWADQVTFFFVFFFFLFSFFFFLKEEFLILFSCSVLFWNVLFFSFFLLILFLRKLRLNSAKIIFSHKIF